MTSTDITIIGRGPMGRALAKASRTAGLEVTSWNRSLGAVDDIEQAGIQIIHDIDQAITTSTVIVACVVNYDAVRQGLAGSSADWTGRVLVNLTSGSPSQAREMSKWCEERGIAYLDGAILTPIGAVEAGNAVVLYSGDSNSFELAGPKLQALGGTQHYLSDEVSRANAYDVSLLDLFATSMYGLVHAYAVASSYGITPSQLMPFTKGMGQLLPQMAEAFAADLERGAFPGDRFAITSAASGIAHVIDSADHTSVDTEVLQAIERSIVQLVADGHGSDGLARLATVMDKSRR